MPEVKIHIPDSHRPFGTVIKGEKCGPCAPPWAIFVFSLPGEWTASNQYLEGWLQKSASADVDSLMNEVRQSPGCPQAWHQRADN
jgi:hypothetical protein